MIARDVADISDLQQRVDFTQIGVEHRIRTFNPARVDSTLRWRRLDSNLYGAFPVKWCFSVYCPFFVRSGEGDAQAIVEPDRHFLIAGSTRRQTPAPSSPACEELVRRSQSASGSGRS